MSATAWIIKFAEIGAAPAAGLDRRKITRSRVTQPALAAGAIVVPGRR